MRQVVHHVPDSHVNAYIRLRLALTEEQPTIKPYEENLWAQLPDAKTAPIEISLALAGRITRSLDAIVALADCGTVRPCVCASRARSAHRGLATFPVRVAWPSSHRAHHRTAQAKILVADSRRILTAALIRAVTRWRQFRANIRRAKTQRRRCPEFSYSLIRSGNTRPGRAHRYRDQGQSGWRPFSVALL